MLLLRRTRKALAAGVGYIEPVFFGLRAFAVAHEGEFPAGP